MEIRPVSHEDLQSLVASLSPAVSAAQVRRRYEESLQGYRRILVADLDGLVVGTVSMGGRGYERPGSLRMFALDMGAAFRNRGVGTALIGAVEAIAADMNLNEVNLEVSVENVGAVRLYECLGYRRLSEQVIDRWDELDEDGISRTVVTRSWLMTKRIPWT